MANKIKKFFLPQCKKEIGLFLFLFLNIALILIFGPRPCSGKSTLKEKKNAVVVAQCKGDEGVFEIVVPDQDEDIAQASARACHKQNGKWIGVKAQEESSKTFQETLGQKKTYQKSFQQKEVSKSIDGLQKSISFSTQSIMEKSEESDHDDPHIDL